MSSPNYGQPQQPQGQYTNERRSQPRNQVHTREQVDADVERLRKKVLPY